MCNVIGRARRICKKRSFILYCSRILLFFSIHYNLWDECREKERESTREKEKERILSFFSQSCSNCTTCILLLWQTTWPEEEKETMMMMLNKCYQRSISSLALNITVCSCCLSLSLAVHHRPWRDNEKTMTIIKMTIDDRIREFFLCPK